MGKAHETQIQQIPKTWESILSHRHAYLYFVYPGNDGYMFKDVDLLRVNDINCFIEDEPEAALVAVFK